MDSVSLDSSVTSEHDAIAAGSGCLHSTSRVLDVSTQIDVSALLWHRLEAPDIMNPPTPPKRFPLRTARCWVGPTINSLLAGQSRRPPRLIRHTPETCT